MILIVIIIISFGDPVIVSNFTNCNYYYTVRLTCKASPESTTLMQFKLKSVSRSTNYPHTLSYKRLSIRHSLTHMFESGANMAEEV